MGFGWGKTSGLASGDELFVLCRVRHQVTSPSPSTPPYTGLYSDAVPHSESIATEASVAEAFEGAGQVEAGCVRVARELLWDLGGGGMG